MAGGDRVSDTVNVDTLVDQAEEHLARAIEFLPASVDISATVYHLEQLRPALSDLAARARDGQWCREVFEGDPRSFLEGYKDMEAEADRLARRVAELEQERENAWDAAQDIGGNAAELRGRVAELERDTWEGIASGRLTRAENAERRVAELEVALPPLERVARAAKNAEKLWDKRMLGASFVVPARDDPDPLTQAWYELNEALDALAGDGGGA